MKLPLVVVHRSLWKDISVHAASASREFGGVIVGRRTRVGSIHCIHAVGLAHKRATDSQVVYDHDEVARARKVAHEVYGPELEPIGGWHTHPYEACSATALMPQISDEDFEEIQEGDIELIAVTFPDPKYKQKFKSGDMILDKTVGSVCVRLEPWMKLNGTEVPCRIALR